MIASTCLSYKTLKHHGFFLSFLKGVNCVRAETSISSLCLLCLAQGRWPINVCGIQWLCLNIYRGMEGIFWGGVGSGVFYLFIGLFEKGSCCMYTRLVWTPASAFCCWDHTQARLQLGHDTELKLTASLTELIRYVNSLCERMCTH